MSTQGVTYLSQPESTVNVKGLSVELRHPNGERRTLPVETIASTYVSVRWGMSGFYDLNLLRNTLTARSGRGLPRQPRKKVKCEWTAVDIMAVREMVNSYFDREREARKVEVLRHQISMPHATGSVSVAAATAQNENGKKRGYLP